MEQHLVESQPNPMMRARARVPVWSTSTLGIRDIAVPASTVRNDLDPGLPMD